jgi:hypothetical protein
MIDWVIWREGREWFARVYVAHRCVWLCGGFKHQTAANGAASAKHRELNV